jgi:TonB family protein
VGFTVNVHIDAAPVLSGELFNVPENRVEGEVPLSAIVLPAGEVGEVRVSQSLPHGLDKAAVDALRQWRFRETIVDGKPVAVMLFCRIRIQNQMTTPDDV